MRVTIEQFKLIHYYSDTWTCIGGRERALVIFFNLALSEDEDDKQ